MIFASLLQHKSTISVVLEALAVTVVDSGNTENIAGIKAMMNYGRGDSGLH